MDIQGGVLDAQLGSHNDSSKGQSPAHVDGTVVESHGCGFALGEELGNQAEADRVLGGLCCCKAHPGRQQLLEAVYL